jgi:hypothetical protein
MRSGREAVTGEEIARLKDRIIEEGVSLRQLVTDKIAARQEPKLTEALETLCRWMDGTTALVEHLLAEHAQHAVPKVQSPYLNAEEAAAYLRLASVKQLYGLIERGKLKPLPGSRKLRFTTDMLDEYLSGEQQ